MATRPKVKIVFHEGHYKVALVETDNGIERNVVGTFPIEIPYEWADAIREGDRKALYDVPDGYHHM